MHTVDWWPGQAVACMWPYSSCAARPALQTLRSCRRKLIFAPGDQLRPLHVTHAGKPAAEQEPLQRALAAASVVSVEMPHGQMGHAGRQAGRLVLRGSPRASSNLPRQVWVMLRMWHSCGAAGEPSTLGGCRHGG
jgi:hypothetical protein